MAWWNKGQYQTCGVARCTNMAHAKQLCNKHRSRLKRHGTVEKSEDTVDRHTPAIERFTKRLLPVPESGCLLWLGVVDVGGYGRMRYEGRNYAVHRFAYEQAFGPIPEGMDVCHKCDVPSCANPAHLFVGTALDNIRDMIRKGRNANMKGKNNPNYKHGRMVKHGP